MELIVGIGLTLLAVIWILVYLLRDQGSIPRATQGQSSGRSTVTFKTYDSGKYKAKNEAREEWLRQHYPDGEKWIFTKVAGVAHRNHNGTYRRRILQQCRASEELQLVPEPDNPFDSNAIAVCRATGEQLGYLNQRLAADMQRWMANGEQWFAVLTEITGNDARTIGGNLALIRTKVPSEERS